MNLGIKLPLNNISIFTPTATTLSTVKSNLLNLMLTEKGERYLKPTYGVGLRRFLFEQNIESIEEEVQYTVRTEVQKWMPSVAIQDITVQGNIDRHSLQIKVNYRLQGTPLEDTLNLTIGD